MSWWDGVAAWCRGWILKEWGSKFPRVSLLVGWTSPGKILKTKNAGKAISGRASSVGCAYRLVKRWSRVRSSLPAHSFVEIWSWKKFYDHSLPSADSGRAVVSYWRKNVHKVTLLVNCLLLMRGLLEGVFFSRITTLWITLIQILSYHDLAFLKS